MLLAIILMVFVPPLLPVAFVLAWTEMRGNR